MEFGADRPGALNRPLALLEVAVAALVTLGAAALFVAMPGLISSGGLPAAQEFITLSPVLFPRLTFATMTFLGILFLARAIRQIPPADPDADGLDAGKVGRVAVIVLFAIVYPHLLPWLGYGLATLLVIGGVTYLLGNRVWWQTLTLAILLPLAIRFVFERLLAISLPFSDIEGLAVAEEKVMRFLMGALFLR